MSKAIHFYFYYKFKTSSTTTIHCLRSRQRHSVSVTLEHFGLSVSNIAADPLEQRRERGHVRLISALVHAGARGNRTEVRALDGGEGRGLLVLFIYLCAADVEHLPPHLLKVPDLLCLDHVHPNIRTNLI